METNDMRTDDMDLGITLPPLGTFLEVTEDEPFNAGLRKGDTVRYDGLQPWASPRHVAIKAIKVDRETGEVLDPFGWSIDLRDNTKPIIEATKEDTETMTDIDTTTGGAWKPALSVYPISRDGTRDLPLIPVGTVFRLKERSIHARQEHGTMMILNRDDGTDMPEFQIIGYDPSLSPLPQKYYGHETGLYFEDLRSLEVYTGQP